MTVAGRGDWDRWWGKVDTLDEVNLLDGFGVFNRLGVQTGCDKPVIQLEPLTSPSILNP